MFSSRLPPNLTPNRVTLALARLRAAAVPIVDLTESNPTRVGLEYPADLLKTLGDARVLAYEPQALGLPAAREAVAGDYRRRGVEVGAGRIVLTASTSEAYALLFKLLCDPGDRVLVPRPSYPLFAHLTDLEAVTADAYELEYHGRWSIDLDGLTRKITPETRAILVVSPNNPTGSVATRAEIETIADLCRSRSVALVGDEVFADYPMEWEGDGIPSVLQQNAALAFSLGGLSKSAGLPQLKLGWIGVAGPDDVVSRALERLEIISDTYLSVSTPVQASAPQLIERGLEIRHQIQRRLDVNLEALRAVAGGHPSCRVLGVDAGWSAVVQVPATEPEESLVVELLERDHVLVHPGYFFDFPREAFMALSLLPHPDRFGPAARKMFRRFE